MEATTVTAERGTRNTRGKRNAIARRCAAPRRFALTLVELLIVIVLVTTLVTTAIPILAPGGDTRKIREASRAINSFFAGAQARAIETGRPYGVAIKRLSADTGNADDNGAGVELAYVEVPPVYAGLNRTSRVRLTEVVTAGNIRQIQLQFVFQGENASDGLPPGWDLDPVPAQFLRPGDTIWIDSALPYVLENGDGIRTVRTPGGDFQADRAAPGDDTQSFFDSVGVPGFGLAQTLSQQNRFYVIPAADFSRTQVVNRFRSLPPGELFSVNLSPRYDATGAELPPPEALNPDSAVPAIAGNPTFWTAPSPYQIFRQPVPAQSQPLQLPAGTAIDLAASGFPDVALHRPNDAGLDPADRRALRDDVLVMFSPEGSIASVTHRDEAGLLETRNVTNSLALLVGRQELIPAERDEDGPATTSENNPIDLVAYATRLEDDETKEKFARYNWLNLDSRWVVIGAQTGSVTTVENAAIPSDEINSEDEFGFAQQVLAVRGNAPRRLVAGGR